MRPPALPDFAQLLLRRLFLEAHEPAELDLHRQIAGGEDVAPPLGEQQVDFRRPAPDPLDLGKERDRFLIVFGQGIEVELAREHELSEAADVARLLPGHARRAHLFVGCSEKRRELGW